MDFKRNFQLLVSIGAVILSVSNSFSINVLTVQDPNKYGSKPGYIDEATLVVEPHGGYTEQSLYLKYSDHEQYPGNNKIEIVHRFELPQGSVVNDLWLWIGNNVMQAIMLDTWTARAVYDSIVDKRRDPAFLSQNGNQYELHIYPLISGSYRKIKLNFITPTLWRGDEATAQLPFLMLDSNNSSIKPLDILFRTQEHIWGQPVILEQPENGFESLVDTLGYYFKHCYISDISGFRHLNIEFHTDFEGGCFFKSNQTGNDLSYFELGFSPKEFFNLTVDTSSQKWLVGLDLCGLFNKDLSPLIPRIHMILSSCLREKDSFQFFIVGAGKSMQLTDGWLSGSDSYITEALLEFYQSDLAEEIRVQTLPHVLFCDKHAATCWKFPGFDDMATCEEYSYITSARSHFGDADVIAAYNHGYEDVLTDEQLDLITASLDSVFLRGGRLLSYYDHNRVGREKLASYYINGLTTKKVIRADIYRNMDGNIGKYFPKSVYHPSVNLLEYDDPSVAIEMMDKDGNAAVISKKIKSGLLVVSGIWAFTDDGALRSLLGVPLLGLNAVSTYRQLDELLSLFKESYVIERFDKAVVFSNSDSLILKNEAKAWVADYLREYGASKPVFNSVNLLDGSTVTPPYFSEQGIDYFGSGYLLQTLADSSYGLHFETHINEWEYIAAVLAPDSPPQRETVHIDVSGDAGNLSLVELWEVNPVLNDPNKPIFFIGSTINKSYLDFDISANFSGQDSTYTKSLSFPISHDSTQKGDILPTMIGFENLKVLFNELGYDTAAIVELAIEYNLLCDYTALLCLEPNDTLHFMEDPFDESEFTSVEGSESVVEDSLLMDIYPNPFNERTTLSLCIPYPAELRIMIYNICGQLVTELFRSEVLAGSLTLYWDGRNSSSQIVSSGVYFVHMEIVNMDTKKITTKLGKMVMIK